MELHEIRYFLSVADQRSFTRAAEVCHVTQPALTRAVRKLEREFGSALLVRERGNLHLTALGRLIAPNLRSIIERAVETRRAADRFLRLDQSSLRLGVMCTVGPSRFTGFLDDFTARWPGVALTVIEGTPDRLKADLGAGDIELAVMADANGFAGTLDAAKLYSEPYVVACSRSHAFARRASLALRDLAGQIYLRRIACEHRDLLARLLSEADVEVVHTHSSERDDWILSMAAAGMGLCFLPAFSAVVPDLVLVPVTEPRAAREICVVTVAGRERSPAAEVLLAAITAYPWQHAPPASRRQ